LSFLVVPFLAVALTSGVNAQTNALVNGGFEDGLAGWSFDGSVPVIKSGGIDGCYTYLGSDSARGAAVLRQTVNLTPGRYQINLSLDYMMECPGYCDEMIWPNHISAEAHYESRVLMQCSDECAAHDWYDHPWRQGHTYNYQGRVDGPIFLEIWMSTGQVVEHTAADDAHYFGGIGIDNISLSVTPIPEPASIAGLLVGFCALVGRRRITPLS